VVFVYDGGMLSKHLRLTSHDIPLPQIGLRVFHTERLTLAISPCYNEKLSKFAVIVSKKGTNAPTRNKMRRRIYEAIGTFRGQITQGYRCIFSLKKGVSSDISYNVILADVTILLKQAGLLCL